MSHRLLISHLFFKFPSVRTKIKVDYLDLLMMTMMLLKFLSNFVLSELYMLTCYTTQKPHRYILLMMMYDCTWHMQNTIFDVCNYSLLHQIPNKNVRRREWISSLNVCRFMEYGREENETKKNWKCLSEGPSLFFLPLMDISRIEVRAFMRVF